MPRTPATSRIVTRLQDLVGGRWTVRRTVVLMSVLAAPLGVVGCFQELDTGAVGGGNGSQNSSLNNDLSQLPCPTGSKACFDLCGSPDCALVDAAVWTNLQTPVIYEADGATTASSCEQIEGMATQIRQKSCAPCHGAGSIAPDGFDYVMDDSKLISGLSNNFTDKDGGPFRMVAPGYPQASWIYQRMLNGIGTMSGTYPSTGMPPPPNAVKSILGPDKAATVIRPTLEDLSVMYGWISQCLVDAGAPYPNYAQGPGYGPMGGGGSITDAGAGGQ